MKRKLFTSLALLAMALLSLGAARQSDEVKRMGIFISNFTEAGLYNFDLEEDGDSETIHFGDRANVGKLIEFGLIHNIINNPKSTVKKCTDKKCAYGGNIISGKAVASSVRKYFDLSIKNQTLEDSIPELYYDGRNYHLEASDWKPDTVYYAEVQEVSRRKGVITMSGELYNIKNKKDRPATFTATAKPHVWDDKDTWAILSLSVEWE